MAYVSVASTESALSARWGANVGKVHVLGDEGLSMLLTVAEAEHLVDALIGALAEADTSRGGAR